MRHTLRGVPALPRTPIGSWRLVTGACYYGWPLLAWPPALYIANQKYRDDLATRSPKA